MFGRKAKQSRAAAEAEPLPDPPATYPDGAPFPGGQHIATMETVSRLAYASGAPERETMVRLGVFVERLIRQPDAVELTTQLLVNLGDGRKWLDSNGMAAEGEAYGVVLEDLSKYWDQSGAMQRLRDGLK